jgi:hypothetical protein
MDKIAINIQFNCQYEAPCVPVESTALVYEGMLPGI